MKVFDSKCANMDTPIVRTAGSQWKSWRTQLVNKKSKELIDDFAKQRMSIGSQIRLIEVHQREEALKDTSWQHELACVERLLESSVVDRAQEDAGRDLELRSSRTLSARVGGGYEFQTEKVDLGIEHLFKHRCALPWTAQPCESVATGPTVPMSSGVLADFSAEDLRVPRLPPSIHPPTKPPERRPSPRPLSTRLMTSTASTSSGAPPTPGADRSRRRCPSPGPAGAVGAACMRGSRVRAASADRAFGAAPPSAGSAGGFGRRQGPALVAGMGAKTAPSKARKQPKPSPPGEADRPAFPSKPPLAATCLPQSQPAEALDAMKRSWSF